MTKTKPSLTERRLAAWSEVWVAHVKAASMTDGIADPEVRAAASYACRVSEQFLNKDHAWTPKHIAAAWRYVGEICAHGVE